jgi:tetratricopeptide (TPR) repeat protein
MDVGINAPAVVQICRRLDGIPLALELAAARIEALTAEQIAQRLDQRFRLLMGGSRTALPRTLDWSYDLLGKQERLLFERLAVFTGGWTLEAAEAVCAGRGLDGEDVLDVLAQLTRKSLVVADEAANGAERYSLLETVRDYARQKLALRRSAQIGALRERHAAFYASLAAQQLPDVHEQPSADVPGWSIESVGLVDAEYDNFRSALTWWIESRRPVPAVRLARRLGAFWMLQGLYAEGRRWFAQLLELDEGTARVDGSGSRLVAGRVEAITAVDRTFILGGIGLFAARQGDYEEARASAEAAAAIWSALGDRPRVAESLGFGGLVAWLIGDTSHAVEQLEEARRVIEQCGRNPRTIEFSAGIQRNLGLVTRDQRDYVRAAEHFRESVRLARLTPGLGYNLPRALCHLARTVFLQGDVAEAKLLFREGLNVMRAERAAGHTLADCLDWIAAIAGAEHRPRDAAVLFGAADAQWQASGAVRYRPERATYFAELANIQSTLAEDEFAAAWSAGRAFSRERAIGYALEQVQ